MRRLVLFAVFLSGCIGNSSGLLDAGTRFDATVGVDAGTRDTGPWDVGRFDTGTSTAASLSVMTWNIETYPMTSSSASMVEQLILQMLPDVLAIQEIDQYRAFNELANTLEDYEGMQVFDPRNFLRVGLLYNTKRVTLLESETLFEDNGYAFPRPPLRVRVQPIGSDFDLDIIVLHLKARSDEESFLRRRRAIEVLDEWMRDRVATEPDIALVGDLNDRLEDPPDRNAFTPLLDAADRYRFLTAPLVEERQYSYIPFPGLIDHIMVTSDALEEYGVEGTTQVIPLDLTVPGYLDHVSDHRPVQSVFRNID